MKKNLMSVIILALLVVNLILTAIIMFSVVSANRKTVALVNNIAAVLDLELNDGSGAEGEESSAVSIADSAVYDIGDSMTVALRPSGDGKEHYALVEVSFSLNTKNEDYETYQPLLAERESKIKSVIIDVIGSYTKEEAMADIPGMQAAILAKVQEMFGSDFIYEAYFRDIKFQ